MEAPDRITVVYVTSSAFKKAENAAFARLWKLRDGRPVADVFDFQVRALQIQETLKVDLAEMVSEEVASAYCQLKVPCVVEHAGLIFEGCQGYPGGLTKPMWDTLGDRFTTETSSANRSAVARAVVAYCDGMTIRTFVGERRGLIAPSPRGKRKFYWDTIFIPDDPSGQSKGLTYAEVAEDSQLGLDYKVGELSQSSAAMARFLEYRITQGRLPLWP